MPLTHYEILGLKPTATPEEIKRAYRRQALHWHPDKNPDNPKAHRRFIAIKDAYAVLSNHERRAFYDAVLRQREAAKRQQPPPFTYGTPPPSPPPPGPRGYTYTPPPRYRPVYREQPTNRGWGSGFGVVFLILMLTRLGSTCNKSSYDIQSSEFRMVQPEDAQQRQRRLDSLFGGIGPRDTIVSEDPPILKRYMGADSVEP